MTSRTGYRAAICQKPLVVKEGSHTSKEDVAIPTVQKPIGKPRKLGRRGADDQEAVQRCRAIAQMEACIPSKPTPDVYQAMSRKNSSTSSKQKNSEVSEALRTPK